MDKKRLTVGLVQAVTARVHTSDETDLPNSGIPNQKVSGLLGYVKVNATTISQQKMFGRRSEQDCLDVVKRERRRDMRIILSQQCIGNYLF